MADAGHILVTFGAVADAESNVASTAAAMNAELADLKAYLAPMVASWTGAAAADYQAKQAQWDSAAADLNAVLQQIGVALGQAHANYTQAETTNAGMWG